MNKRIGRINPYELQTESFVAYNKDALLVKVTIHFNLEITDDEVEIGSATFYRKNYHVVDQVYYATYVDSHGEVEYCPTEEDIKWWAYDAKEVLEKECRRQTRESA